MTKKQKILIADDERINRKVLSDIFEEDYDVNSEVFSKGYIELPAAFFGADNIDITNAIQFIGWLRENVKIKVSAKPKLENIVPDQWNQIVFSDVTDIDVERDTVWIGSDA